MNPERTIDNVLIQARTRGLTTGSLESLRALVARAFAPVRYGPRSSSSDYRDLP